MDNIGNVIKNNINTQIAGVQKKSCRNTYAQCELRNFNSRSSDCDVNDFEIIRWTARTNELFYRY